MLEPGEIIILVVVIGLVFGLQTLTQWTKTVRAEARKTDQDGE